jgi:hypothetical protein
MLDRMSDGTEDSDALLDLAAASFRGEVDRLFWIWARSNFEHRLQDNDPPQLV